MGSGTTMVIVPCYNEEHRLSVPSFVDFAREDQGFRFLFVDDGSRDQTLKVLQRLCEQDPEVFRALSLPVNRGKAEAVRQGVLHALQNDWQFVGYWDADLATPLTALVDLRRVMLDDPTIDVVLGARVKLLGRRIERRLLRHYLGRSFATVAAFVLNIEIYDTQCGAKLFRVSEVLRRVFAEPFASRWIFDVEVLARFLLESETRRLDPPGHARIYEVPLLEWKDAGASRVRPRDFLVAPWELAQINRRYRLRSRRRANRT